MTARSRPHLHRSPQFLLRCMCQWQYYYIAYLDLAHAPSSSCPRSFKNVYFLNELDTKRRGYYVQLVYSFFFTSSGNCMQSLSINCYLTKFFVGACRFFYGVCSKEVTILYGCIHFRLIIQISIIIIDITIQCWFMKTNTHA